MFLSPSLVEKATRKFLPSVLFKTRIDGDSGEERLKKLSLLIGNLKAVRKGFGGATTVLYYLPAKLVLP